MDQCKHCQLRGDMVKCYQEDCTIHESWYVKELIKQLQNTSSNSDYVTAKRVFEEWYVESRHTKAFDLEEWLDNRIN